MNKTMTFFTAPLTAFFMPQVFRDAARESAGRGVLYQFYLACLAVLFMLIFIIAAILPKADQLADWLSKNTPVMIWTPQGLSMGDPTTVQPFVLRHPQYGDLAIIDMDKTNVTVDDIKTAYLYITSKKVYTRSSNAEVGSRDLTAQPEPGRQVPQRVRIDGEMLLKMYQSVKNKLPPFLMIGGLLVCFLAFLLIAFFYSLVGLLFNMLLKGHLSYGAVFNLACFVISVGFTITWLDVLPLFRGIPWPGMLTVVINLVYLFFAVRIVGRQETEAPKPV